MREVFAVSGDMLLGEDTCVHDVSAVLKAFLRDLKEPLLPRELYTAFIHTAGKYISMCMGKFWHNYFKPL